MDVISIKIEDIDTSGRLRPVNPEVVITLTHDIKSRGLCQPIEVAKTKGEKAYRLIAGGHRLAACQQAGFTEISAFLISGSEADLRRHEILENIARNELNKLERAQFLAELKRLYQEENPQATNGGDRRSNDFQSANDGGLKDWYAEVASRSDRAIRTIEREASIGERLTQAAADTIRGTDYEDNQKELEALSRLDAVAQLTVAEYIAGNNGTVAQAVKVINGHAKAEDISPEDKQYMKLLDTWNRTGNPKAKKRFLEQLVDDDWISDGGLK